MPGHRQGTRRVEPSARRTRRVPRRSVLIGAGVVLLAAVLWLGREAIITRNSLLEASDHARILQQQITDGETKRAAATLTDLQESTHDARTHTDGPLWAALAAVPFLGDSVDAARVVSRSLDDIAVRGIPPVVEVSSSLSSDVFAPKNGRFDLKTLAKLAPSLTTASEVLTVNGNEINRIDRDGLIGPLERPITDLQGKIADAQSAASAGARAMRLAPSMLGGDGKRKYLLLFQNNAEVRSTGGLPGAFAILRANRGKITFGLQGSSGDVPRFSKPVVKLSDEEKAIYGELMATDFRDTNFTPDFPRTAEIAQAMVKARLGVKVNGVLSIDPVALQLLLKGTGPIEAAQDTTLTGDNAVDILLNQVYATYENPAAQDAFFADSAERIFDAVIQGAGDSRETLTQLVRASAQHRVLLWSDVDKEQRSLAGTRVAGLLAGADPARPQLGVYLNDSTQSKMQYYLNARTTATSVSCDSDGQQTIRFTTVFRSTAPEDASNLPKYITGSGDRASEGTMVLDTRFFGPAGGRFVSFSVNKTSKPINGLQFQGRPVNIGAFTLEPGQSVRIDATVVTDKDQTRDAQLSVTPTVNVTKNGIRIPSTCD